MVIIYKKGAFVKAYMNAASGLDPEYAEGQGIKKAVLSAFMPSLEGGV